MTYRLVITLWLTFLTILALYTLFWYWTKKNFEAQLQSFYTDAAQQGFYITGKPPEISGFPGPFKITASGAVIYDSYELIIPQFNIQSFFIQGMPVEISIPYGAILQGTDVPALTSIDRLYLLATMPSRLPENLTLEQLKLWRHNDEHLEINNVLVEKKELIISGMGKITLDDKLQPTGQLDSVIIGAQSFISWLKMLEIINSKDAMIASTIIKNLMKKNPETGTEELRVTLTLQNQKLFLGPLPVASLPALNWDTHSQPALLQ